ncbi:MAG: hypothetical protein ACXU9U_02755, partial [Parachlamydiaceae bacterium]
MILVPQGFVKDRLRDFALPALFVTVVTLNPVSGVTTGISMAVSPMIGHVSLRLLENFGKLLSDFRGQSWNGTSVVETVLAGNFRLVGTHYLVGVMGSRQSIYRLLTTHLLYYGAINVGEATLKHFMLSISRFLRNPEIKEMLGKKITVSIINLLLKLPFIIDEEISAELNALKATLQIETEEINPPTLNEAIDLMSLETGEEEAVLPRIDPHVEAEKEGMLEELDAPVVPIPTNAGAQAFAGGHYNSTNSVVLLPKSKENNVSGQSNARNTPARQVQHLFKKSNSANWEFRKFTNLEEDPSPRFREPKPYPLNPHPSREKILPEQENIPPDTLRRSDSLRMEPSEFKLPIS